MTQREMLERHLLDIGSITSAEAMAQYGIYRLASRISELKKDGMRIGWKMESNTNRYGKTVSFKRYFLEDET